ncbi:hypothetical protein EG329_010790 [Mollisiaceae sp. DMI_Dod_QoI]|nr:hypothetical protein EG329_010790 [Helotiales sp. DMI_Dod_QoI]
MSHRTEPPNSPGSGARTPESVRRSDDFDLEDDGGTRCERDNEDQSISPARHRFEGYDDCAVQKSVQDSNDTSPPDSSYPGANTHASVRERYPISLGVEEEIDRLLAGTFCEGIFLGESWQDGWYEAQISQWEGRKNVVSNGYLQQHGLKATRGRITMTIRLADCPKTTRVDFVVARNCPTQFLFGIMDSVYLSDAIKLRKDQLSACSKHPGHPFNSYITFQNCQQNFGYPHSDAPKIYSTSTLPADTSAEVIHSSSRGKALALAPIVPIWVQLLAVALIARQVDQILYLIYNCIVEVIQRALIIARILLLLRLFPYIPWEICIREVTSLCNILWQAFASQLPNRRDGYG